VSFFTPPGCLSFQRQADNFINYALQIESNHHLFFMKIFLKKKWEIYHRNFWEELGWRVGEGRFFVYFIFYLNSLMSTKRSSKNQRKTQIPPASFPQKSAEKGTNNLIMEYISSL
jgi:hypothetical protein